MANLLGTVSAQMKVNVDQAVAAYMKVQVANRDTVTALRGSAATLNTVGNAMGVVGLGLAAALGYAAKSAADFNAQMNYFQAISGATVSQMDQIRAKALELDQTTMYSTKDIANMFVELAKAGESSKQIIGGVADAVVNLAQAAQIPLNTAVTTIVSVLNAFNLTAGQSADVANRLAGAANASILEVSDLATSLKYVSGVANQLGISFDETTTALDLLGNAGIKGSMGGTELRQIMVSLLGTTKAGSAELEKLGILTKQGGNEFFTASGKAKSLSDIFQILQDHLKGLNQEQQLAALKILFNNRALAAAAILTKDGASGFAAMNAQIAGTSAADVAAKRMDNLSGDVKKLTSSLQTMAIQAGQPLQQFLRSVVQSLTSLVHGFENLSPATQSNIIHMLALGAAFLIASSALIKIVAFALKLWETFGKLAIVVRFLVTILEAVGEGIAAVGAAILASPIAIIVAVVLALAAAFFFLYEKVQGVRDFFNMIGRGLRTAFEATVNWFKTLPETFEHIWNDIKQWFRDGVNAIIGSFQNAVNFFQRVGHDIANAFSTAWNSVVNFFESLPGEVGKGIDNAASAVGDFFSNLPYKLGYWLGEAIGTIVRWAIELGPKIGQAFVNMGNAIATFFTQLPGKIASWLVNTSTSIENWIGRVKQDIGQWIVSFSNAVENFFTQLPGRVASWLQTTAQKFIQWELDMTVKAGQFAEKMLNNIIGFLERLPGDVANWLGNALLKTISWGENLINLSGQIGMKVINGILNWLNQLPGLVGRIFNNVVQAFKDMVSSAFDAAKGFAEGLWNGFKHGLGIHSPSYIEVAIGNITKTMGTETDKIQSYVKKVNGLGQQMMDLNPATATNQYTAGVLSSMNGSVSSQLSQLKTFNSLMSNGQSYYRSGSASEGNASGDGGPTKVLEVNVYNPVAESTSTSATQQLRTLADMGAF